MSDSLLSENADFRVSVGMVPSETDPGVGQVGTVALRLPFPSRCLIPEDLAKQPGAPGKGQEEGLSLHAGGGPGGGPGGEGRGSGLRSLSSCPRALRPGALGASSVKWQ